MRILSTTLRNNLERIYPLVLLGGFWIATSWSLLVLQAISSLLLLQWLGFLLLRLVTARWGVSQYVLLAFSIPVSLLGISAITYYLPGENMATSVFTQVLLSLLVAVMVVATIIRKDKGDLRESMSGNMVEVAVALLPVALFITRSASNPYLADMDGQGYVAIFNKISEVGFDGSFLSPRRALFSHLVTNLHSISGIPFDILFKWVLPLVTWLVISGVILFAIKKVEKKWWPIIVAAFVASPALITAIDRFKPEAGVWVIAMIIAVLSFYAIANKLIAAYVFALLLAVLSVRVHDTGVILLVSVLITGIGVVIRHRSDLRKYLTPKNLMWGGVFALPYLFLFDLFSLVTFLQSGLIQFVGDVSWNPRWWFLDHYSSAGAQLGWPGWSFIIYYAYNGGFVLLALLILLIGILRRNWIMAFSSPFVLFVSYFGVAEILPRFGVYILPDRAFVHAYLFAVLLFVLLLAMAKSLQLPKLVMQVGSVTVVLAGMVSILTSQVLTQFEGGIVSGAESGVISAIKSTEEDARIVSPQRYNNVLVEVYGDRVFLVDKGSGDVSSLLQADRYDTSREVVAFLEQETISETITRTLFDDRGWQISKDTSSRIVSSSETVIPSGKVIHDSTDNYPVYVLYSFAKTNGMLARLKRLFWLDGIAVEYSDQFRQYSGGGVVYSDDSAILIRIR